MISSVGNELLQNTELPKDVIVYIIQEKLMISEEDVQIRHARLMMEFSAHTFALTTFGRTAYPSGYRYAVNWEKEQRRRREKEKECRWDVILVFVIGATFLLVGLPLVILRETGVI
jgi:hypothetical protein